MQKLIELMGAEKVSVSPETLEEYSGDYTEAPPHLPDAVVHAESPEEIRKVLAFAAENKVPVVPVVSHSNVGGLTIPEKGGSSSK